MTVRPLKVLGVHANSGSRNYRIIPQLNWMQKEGHQVRLERYDAPHLAQVVAWCDVLVLQMVFDIALAREARALGKTVLFECDDLIHKTHAKHYSYEETKGLKNQLRWWWRIFRMLRACDGLVVSNAPLKRVYGWMARETLVFGNYLELGHWLKEAKPNHSDRVRLLWAGSTSHTGDLEWVKPIIAAIIEKYPQVQFIYVGHGGVPTDDLYTRFIYGDDLFEGLPRERRESLLGAPPNIWPYILASLSADIAIAPLEKNYFNRFKTQCKYLEYAINGIPAVYASWFYTDVKDYGIPGKTKGGNTYTAGASGVVADSPQEWIEALSLLIENATLRLQIGAEARRVAVEEYDFAIHAPRWQAFVEKLAWRSPPSPSSPSAIAHGASLASMPPTTLTPPSSRT